MTTIKLKISELRKRKGAGQQELAEALGVSFQAVSKWETGATMPDIALLPSIAEYFSVSVDQILGLKPLGNQAYIPRDSDTRDYWNDKSDKLYKNRKYFWNEDYLQFLIDGVWRINKPIHILDFRCGEAYLGIKLLELLPAGSTYTGIDNEYFTGKAKLSLENAGFTGNFIVSDIYSLETSPQYDMAICQAGLRHMNRPMEVLQKMISSVKPGGLVICADVNREFENVGLYADNMDYGFLCTAFDFHPIWNKELELEGRDYAIGMRLPFYMQELGLHDVDVRMNDKVMYAAPPMLDYEEKLEDFINIKGWYKPLSYSEQESIIERLMSCGIDRSKAGAFVALQEKLGSFFRNPEPQKSFINIHGMLITYGRK